MVKVLDTTQEKGRGKKRKLVLDELYTYKIDPKKCKFDRKASKLYTATITLSEHVELKYRIFKDRKVKDSSSLIALIMWINKGAIKEVPDFETSLVDQIIIDYQAFPILKVASFRQ